MASKRWIGLGGILGLALLSVGCGKTVVINNADGTSTEMPEKTYMAQKQNEAALDLAEKFSPAFKAPNAELSAQGEMMHGFQNILAMVMMPQIAQAMQQDGYWQYETAKLNFWGNVIAGPGTALLQPFANRLAYGQKGGFAHGGGRYTELNIGNRVAGGGGKGSKGGLEGAGGSGGGSSASGDTDISDLYFSLGDESPFQTGDGEFLYGNDSQYQTGDGTQGQVFTRPINQPQPEGDVNNNSTGLNNEPEVGIN